tara:strand:- start:82 stop:408 length:327 start_codon:yes stop_codon:yes gene_type:complete
LKILKVVHGAKRTFNDFKTDNIMINTNGKMEDNPDVFLIDFGCASKYECATTKKHITESEEVMYFRGNLIFSSIRQMDFFKTSRRDDLIAVFYLMFTLLNDDDFFLDG